DAVIFTQYFLVGLDAFPASTREAAIAASDVNADGIILTYQDLVYLYRIIIGEALPFPKQATGASVNAYFQQDPTNHMVAVSCSLPLAGAFMLIRGNVTPTFLIPQTGWTRQANYDGTYTRILILGDPGQPYTNGVWFTYQGTGELEYVETTDWHNTLITSHITHGATDCGDFDGSGGINISDVVYVIRYIFSGGVAPIDIHGGDVNCDNTCDISDIVYLLAYIFSGGPAPCANCK
ncbi:MAG: dockerin type I repeat-containing protein, partial [candidate division Zixibacteria bacterium]|nr:dockerin type I repeat-containing protein [candidate division Zixibacteria bacterium]